LFQGVFCCLETKHSAKTAGRGLIYGPTTINFGQLLRHLSMPHIRFHDLRHSAATNMHELTGDFYTVGVILGHTLKGIGISLGISTSLESVTAQYVNVRLDRKQTVLEAYHNALHPNESMKIAGRKLTTEDRDAR